MRIKRTCIVALCLAVAITCSGCKSEEVKRTESLIDGIKASTVYKHETLDQALDAYNALDEPDKAKVENVEKLNSAVEYYQKIVSDEASEIIECINDIPSPLDPEDDSAEYRVSIARQKVNRSTDDVAAKVTNIQILEDAEKILSDDKVKKALEAIDAIGTVSLKKSDLIKAANTAYKNVPDNRTDDVTNKDLLTAANAELSRLEKEEKDRVGKAAFETLRAKKDEVEGITWYYPSTYPQYTNTRSFVLPYIGDNSGNSWMRLKFNYFGNSWVFYDRAIVWIDGSKYKTIEFDYFDIIHDAVHNGVVEAADIEADAAVLEAIANSEKAIIRFQGDDYYYDITVSSKDKKAIQNVIDAFDYMSMH